MKKHTKKRCELLRAPALLFAVILAWAAVFIPLSEEGARNVQAAETDVPVTAVLTYSDDENGGLIIDGIDEDLTDGFYFDIIVPAEHSGKPVRILNMVDYFLLSSEDCRVATLDLSGAVNLTEIKVASFMFPEGPEKIIFSGANSLVAIKDGAFMGATITGLEMTGLEKLETIHSGAFAGCLYIGDVVLSDMLSLKEIEDTAFFANHDPDSGNDGMASVTFKNLPALERIGCGAFSYADNLAEVNFVDLPALKTISENAFYGGAYESVDLSNLPALKFVGNDAFYSDSLLQLRMGFVEKIGYMDEDDNEGEEPSFLLGDKTLIVLDGAETLEKYSAEGHVMTQYAGSMTYETGVRLHSRNNEYIDMEKLYGMPYNYVLGGDGIWQEDTEWAFPMPDKRMGFAFDGWENTDGELLSVTDTVDLKEVSARWIKTGLTEWGVAGIAAAGVLLIAAAVIMSVHAVRGNRKQAALASDGSTPLPSNLTAKEREVAVRILKGRNRNEIAEELGISPETVKDRTERVYKKSGCTKREEFIIKYK